MIKLSLEYVENVWGLLLLQPQMHINVVSPVWGEYGSNLGSLWPLGGDIKYWKVFSGYPGFEPPGILGWPERWSLHHQPEPTRLVSTWFGVEDLAVTAAVTALTRDINEKDFKLSYEVKSNKWTLLWKWNSGEGPQRLQLTVLEYWMPRDAWQVSWDQEQWECSWAGERYYSLITVVQQNKEKGRPVLLWTQLVSWCAHSRRWHLCWQDSWVAQAGSESRSCGFA